MRGRKIFVKVDRRIYLKKFFILLFSKIFYYFIRKTLRKKFYVYMFLIMNFFKYFWKKYFLILSKLRGKRGRKFFDFLYKILEI